MALGSSQTLRAFQTLTQFPIVQPNTCCIAIKSSFQKDLPTNTKKNTKSDMSPESRNSATSGQASIGCNQLLQFPYLAKVVTATRKAKIHQKLHSKWVKYHQKRHGNDSQRRWKMNPLERWLIFWFHWESPTHPPRYLVEAMSLQCFSASG